MTYCIIYFKIKGDYKFKESGVIMTNSNNPIFKELDTLPINVLVFELTHKDLHFCYVNDSFLETYNIINNIYSDKLFKSILFFLKNNIIKLDRSKKLVDSFVYKNNNRNTYGVVQNTFHLKKFNDKQYIYVYSFLTTSNFINQANLSNIMTNFTQPSFLLNNVGEIISVNDAIFEMLNLKKSEDLSTINNYFHKLQYLQNKYVSDFINDDSINQKYFDNIDMKNAENEEVTANFTITKIKNLNCKTFFLVIFDETVKNIISSQAVKQLEKMAYYDHLCNVYNRRYFLNTVNSKIQNNHNHCILIFDIDFFKSVNDNYGHLTGDEVIKVISGISDSFITSSNGLFARYGGEEFIGYLEEKSVDECFELAEMIRQEIEATTVFTEGKEVKVTISIGIAHSQKSVNNLDDLIRSADSALYTAKNSGRNNVQILEI